MQFLQLHWGHADEGWRLSMLVRFYDALSITQAGLPEGAHVATCMKPWLIALRIGSPAIVASAMTYGS
jgi:hypothetical protein